MANIATGESTPDALLGVVRRTRVSIVVPCFNEEAACEHLRERLEVLREQLNGQYELYFVIVDDGSTDQSVEKLHETFCDDPQAKIVCHEHNRGIGAAIMTGIRHANTSVVCSMDFDCSYDPTQLAAMIPLLEDDIDIVTASPYHPQGLVRNVPAWRLALSKAASRMYSFFLTNQLHTYTSCFRVYRRRAVEGIRLRNQGFVGVVELLWEVDRRGGRIVECPATLGVREYGQSKMRTVQVMLDHFKLMATNLFRRA